MDLEVIMLPVKAGDATLLRYSDHHCQHTVLIDTGLVQGEALAYLQSIGEHHLDLIILSHPDMDHLGGLLAIVEDEKMSVDRLWCFDLDFLREFIRTGVIPSPRPSTREIDYALKFYAVLDRFSDSLKVAQERGVELLQVSEGYRFCLGGMLIEVLYPPHEFYNALRHPWALKALLRRRKWPDDWNTDGEEPTARPLSKQERKERLSNLLENADAQENPLLNPPEPWPEDETEFLEDSEGLPWRMVGTLYNNMSIVVKVSFLRGIKGPTLLFPGDLSDWTLLVSRQWHNLQADILKFPHHGSNHLVCDTHSITSDLSIISAIISEFGFPVPLYWYAKSAGRVKGVLNLLMAPRKHDAEFIHRLVNPSQVLVFPLPRHDLPNLNLNAFRSHVVANRTNRTFSALNSDTNTPSPATLVMEREADTIHEIT